MQFPPKCSLQRILDRHESLINYANHLRTTAALPSFLPPFSPRGRAIPSSLSLCTRDILRATVFRRRAVLVWPRPISRVLPPFFPLASETTRLARGLFIKTFGLTRFIDAFVLYFRGRDIYIHILVNIYYLFSPFFFTSEIFVKYEPCLSLSLSRQ